MKPDFLRTEKKESSSTWRFRQLVNWAPAYFGTGGKVIFWSADSLEVQIRLRLSLLTRNYVGTLFGGSLFAAADPFYMIMLMRALGSSYVVWDKAAHIRFKKPGKSTLYAHLRISDQDLQTIKDQVRDCGHSVKTFTIRWVDKGQVVHAEIERQCYIADKEFYRKKKGESQTPRF